MILKKGESVMNRKVISMALSIALLPPVWAVLSGHAGIRFGATALICASVYASAPSAPWRARSVSIGFLLGDLWAVLTLALTSHLPLHPDASLYLTLFIMGGLAVLLSGFCPKYISTPAWLGGLAIGLTILTLTERTPADRLPLPVQIAIAMLAGIWYVGVIGDWFADRIYKVISRNN